MAAPAALQLDELVEEILLRIPADDPARLLAAALVCKRWCRLATSRGFRRRFRDLHRAPPLLGFLFNDFEHFRFIRTSSFRPPNAADRRRLVAIHSRHGRVLLRHRDGGTPAAWAYPFIVWDPIADEQRVLPLGPLGPHMATLSWSAAVLCAAGDGCDHLDCHRGPFIVVCVGATMEETFSCCVYSSEEDKWSRPMSIDAQGHHNCLFDLGNVAVVGTALYFKFFLSAVDMLKYDLVTGKMSLVCVSEDKQLQHGLFSVLMATDDGRLGCAFVNEAARLFLCSRNDLDDGPDEEVTWEQSRVIELRRLLPNHALSVQPDVAGFVDNGAGGVIFIRTRAQFFTIDLRSGRVMKAGKSHGCHGIVVPYVSFCTPGTRERWQREKARWCGPRAGWLKANVNGAFDCETGEGGIGVIIRDSAGTVLLSAWQYVPRGMEADEIEALAAREGLLLAAKWLPNKVILEMDCNAAVCALQKRGRQSNLQFILEEAMKAAERLPEWTVVQTERGSNGAAHELAQLAKRTKHSATWHSATPVCIEQIIARECNQLFE